jgi:urease alpha subunit
MYSTARLDQLSAHLAVTPHRQQPADALHSPSPAPAAGGGPRGGAAATGAQQRPNGYGTVGRVHDLLITNGRVIDPANSIDAVLDVAVRWGKIVAVGERLDPSDAASVFDASGLIVAPGLIDAHVHCFTGCTTLGIPADEYCLGRGCTTVVDAGSAGPATLPAFREFIVKQQRTRVLSMCHVASAGLANGVFVEPQER